MDQHPIPQDVTGFQFKLIGSMTVKQFGYVAFGAIMAVILYYLPMNTPFAILIKLFLIPIVGASGIVIAFVPVEGRPIDVMATNFAKALFAPNQYIYKRQGRKMSFSTVTVKAQAVQQTTQTTTKTPAVTPSSSLDEKEAKLRAFLLSSEGRVQNDLDKKEASFIKSFGPIPARRNPTTTAATPKPAAMASAAKPAIISQKPTPTLNVQRPQVLTTTTPPTVTPTPVQQVQIPQKETPTSLEQKEQQLEQELTQAKQEEARQLPQAAHDAAHLKAETLTKQLASIHTQKLQLEQELTKLKNQLSEQKENAATTQSVEKAQPIIPAPTKPAIPIQDPKFVKVVAKTPKEATPDLPKVSDTPNVVVGIVKDPRGNVLSNILVEVKDKAGNPVRAFKTNPLGQFASATPLSTGVYTIELEDPKGQNNFDVIQITANNEIMRPIEIISHDAREALRQQLFNQ